MRFYWGGKKTKLGYLKQNNVFTTQKVRQFSVQFPIFLRRLNWVKIQLKLVELISKLKMLLLD